MEREMQQVEEGNNVSARLMIKEVREIGVLGGPNVIAGLLLFFKPLISMAFLGGLGGDELAGGVLAISFGNISATSVLTGLALCMEGICSQAYGANQWALMRHTLQRMIAILLTTCIAISILWINSKRNLVRMGLDADMASTADTYLLYSLPDLAAQAFLHPLKIYLRAQKITLPITACTAIGLALHWPFNFILVSYLGMEIRGVALAAALFNVIVLLSLLAYLYFYGGDRRWWEDWSTQCFREWGPLLKLAIPSCASVAVEWWFYEVLIFVSAFLPNGKTAVACMGVVIQTTALLYVFPSSLSQAVSTRVGNEVGAGRPHKARMATIVGLCISVAMGVAAMIFTITVRHVWVGIFTREESIIRLTQTALPIVGLCELGNCPQTTASGVLRGLARPSTAAIINFISFYGPGLLVALFLAFLFKLQLVGLLLGLLAAQVTCASFMIAVVLRTDWNFEAYRALQLTGSHIVEGDEELQILVQPP